MSRFPRPLTRGLGLLAAALLSLGVSACGISAPVAGHDQIVAVGAENEYANVIAQIGGRYVKVAAIMSNPNTDPHTFEASPSVAATVAEARLVVQNGVGYDTFMSRVEAATPAPGRRVIDVQSLLHLPAGTPNPHLWYAPATMPRVAQAIAAALSGLLPAHRHLFNANLRRFDRSLAPWRAALAAFRAHYGGTPVAVTEPVADDMLEAAGARIETPFSLQADIMNGTDPAPQAVSLEDALFSRHAVKVFLYNRQVTDTLTDGFLRLAEARHIPVVGVYETMPTGYDYQGWMLAEVRALTRAVSAGTSTTRL